MWDRLGRFMSKYHFTYLLTSLIQLAEVPGDTAFRRFASVVGKLGPERFDVGNLHFRTQGSFLSKHGVSFASAFLAASSLNARAARPAQALSAAQAWLGLAIKHPRGEVPEDKTLRQEQGMGYGSRPLRQHSLLNMKARLEIRA